MLTTLLLILATILPFDGPQVHITDGTPAVYRAKWVQPGVSPVPVFKVEINGVILPQERQDLHNDGNVVTLTVWIPFGTTGRCKVTAYDGTDQEIRHTSLQSPIPFP